MPTNIFNIFFFLFIAFVVAFIALLITIRLLHNRKNFNLDSKTFTIVKFILLAICITMLICVIVFFILWVLGV